MKLPLIQRGKGAIDAVVDDILRQLNSWREQLVVSKLPLYTQDGVLFTNVDVQSGDNTINHGLRRAVQGWVILRVQAAAAVSISESSSNDKNLILNCSGSARIAVWVY